MQINKRRQADHITTLYFSWEVTTSLHWLYKELSHLAQILIARPLIFKILEYLSEASKQRGQNIIWVHATCKASRVLFPSLVDSHTTVPFQQLLENL